MGYDKEKVLELKSRNLTVFEEVYEIRMGISMRCTRKCSFCGTSKEPQEDMSQETFTKIVESSTERLRRITLSSYGEAIIHPKVCDYIKQFREKRPKLQISIITNTDYFRIKGFDLLFDLYKSGLNMIHADLYDDKQKEWFLNQLKIHRYVLEKEKIRVVDFYAVHDNVWRYRGVKDRLLFYATETGGLGSGGTRMTRKFHTWAGNLKKKEWVSKLKTLPYPIKAVCTEPLKYMTITSGGDVCMCCRDGGVSGVVGNVKEQGINEIWQSDKMQIARRVLCNGRRDLMLPCILCNAKSFRFGLYPYWGREDYDLEYMKKSIKEISRLNKKEPIYQNILDYLDNGWVPGEIMTEVLKKFEVI